MENTVNRLSTLNVRAILSVPDSTAFWVLFSTSLLLLPTISYIVVSISRWWWCWVVSLRNQGTAALIPNVGGHTLQSSLCSSSLCYSPTDSSFWCSDPLGLVVDDSSVNSVASHIFMIYKHWNVPIGLYVIRLVCKPWLGRRLPGRNFIYESQIMQHLLEKYLWSRVVSGKVHVLVLCKLTTPRQNVSHTFWGLTTQPAPRLV